MGYKGVTTVFEMLWHSCIVGLLQVDRLFLVIFMHMWYLSQCCMLAFHSFQAFTDNHIGFVSSYSHPSIFQTLITNGMSPDTVSVIAGLSNDYSDYVTTFEEYQVLLCCDSLFLTGPVVPSCYGEKRKKYKKRIWLIFIFINVCTLLSILFSPLLIKVEQLVICFGSLIPYGYWDINKCGFFLIPFSA